MNIRATSTTAGTEPIPGYTLRKRLGAGGYGEVWLADAPGGLQKAVKLIYGSVDDARAANELRSLERIRAAHHPFLLSLERIEVVQGKVIIVTELAEGSLQDRFLASRRQGAPGIPRNELLEYLRDSADALDFLAQKHSLQHLDVKPGNLLIIAKHIKVADFGLVKDLHDPNQSLVSGLTPTYSAPEVFDGRPDFRSDQYSLAIVYMEMLTGRLPFSGKNAAELARQHLNQAPDLIPLPPADRKIVQRALSKNPLDRYSTCRQFVDQLFKVRSAVVVATPDTSDRGHNSEEVSSKSILATDTRNWSTSRKHQFARPIPLKQIVNEWNTPRAFFIGLGGKGVQALRELRTDFLHNVDSRLTTDDYGWLALDSTREDLESALDGARLERLPIDCAIHLPILSPQGYRKIDSELFAPISRRWLYNIPKTLKTEGVRPIATLALVAHYPALYKILETKLEALIKLHQADHECHSPLRVYVLSSLHGGTGSAWLGEIGLMVRRALKRLTFQNYRLCAVATAATTTNNQNHANLKAANAIACLSELAHFMDSTSEKPSIDYRSGQLNNCDQPFDWVTLVDGGLMDDLQSTQLAAKRLARCVALDAQTLCGAALQQSRQQSKHADMGWLRTASCSSIQSSAASTPEALARICAVDALSNLDEYLTTGKSSTRKPELQVDQPSKQLSTSFLPLTKEAIEELVQRSLREMGFIFDITPSDEVALTWRRRLIGAPQDRQTQLALDLDHWHRAIARQVQLRVYNWHQIDRIQVEVIQGLLNFLDSHLGKTLERLKLVPDLLPRKLNVTEAAASYVSEFSQACFNFLEQVRCDSNQFSLAIVAWKNAIVASFPGARLDSKSCHRGFTPKTQTLCSNVLTQLEDKLFLQLNDILCSASEKIGLPKVDAQSTDHRPQSVLGNENEFLHLAQESIVQSCKEMGINPEDLQCRLYHHTTVNVEEIKDLLPPLAEGGGEIVRMVVTNEEQLAFVDNSIRELGIANSSTILPGTPSLGTQIVCDAVNLSVPHIVSSLWRPTGSTLSLAERLRTRVDIEWPDASLLLSRATGDCSAATKESEKGIGSSGGTANVVVPVNSDGASTNHLATQYNNVAGTP